MTFVPRDYQEQHLIFAASNPRSINRSEPGTGKTPTAVVLSNWYVRSQSKKVIWVQPNSLRKKNRDEILKFSNLCEDDVEILDKSHETLGPRKRKGVEGACPHTGFKDYIADSKASIFVVGYKFFTRFWQRMLKFHPEIDLLVGDETHLPGGWSTHNSQSTLAMFGALRTIKGFYPMTGSLLRGSYGNAFPLIHAIGPRWYGSWNGFLSQHAGYIDDYGKVQYWINGDKLTHILDQISVKITFKEAYGDQKRVPLPEVVDMGPKMRAAYDEFSQMAVLELEKSFLDGSLPGVAALRARQIMSHPETFGLCDGEISGKDERLAIHAADHVGTGGLIVFSPLVPEVERCAKILRESGLSVGVIHGGVSVEKREKIDEDYRIGKLDSICGTYLTCGTGFNWQRTNTMILVNKPYGPDEMEQAIRRGERSLRDQPLRIIDMEYTDSIDQNVRKILEKKQKVDNSIS